MKILLTGGAGMVGSSVRRRLSPTHHVLAPSRAKLDLLDAAACSSFVRAAQPDVVVHAAARVGGLGASSVANATYLAENTRLSLNVIEAAAAHNVSRVLNIASAVIYPTATEVSVEEDLLTGPPAEANLGYALGKISALYFGEALTSELPTFSFKTLVPCNLYGPGDNYEDGRAHLIASAISKVHRATIRRDRSVTVWGDGTARREMLFVEDLADAVARAISQWHTLPRRMNVGTGADCSVADYYRAVAEVVGFRGDLVFDESRPVGVQRRLLNVDRATAWGWTAKTSLMDGLRTAYAEYKREN